jgi:hypothetical protein
MKTLSCTELEFKAELDASAMRHDRAYVGMLLDARPSKATPEVLAAWAHGMACWPLAKIRRHQRINYSHPKRTADLDVMQDVYRRAVEIKCFPDDCYAPCVSAARYAKGMVAVHCPPDGSGFKTRASRLAGALAGGRYSHREDSYIMSPKRARKLADLYYARWDTRR